jgi:hypothetical protein
MFGISFKMHLFNVIIIGLTNKIMKRRVVLLGDKVSFGGACQMKISLAYGRSDVFRGLIIAPSAPT